MMKRANVHKWALGVAALILGSAVSASAQVTRYEPRQAIGFNMGYFALQGTESRADGDALFANLSAHAFDIGDLNGFTFGGEWLFGVTENLEFGAGLGYYQKSTPSVYRAFTGDDGFEIAQEFKLRTVPVNFTARFLPLGRGGIEPYFGVGVGIFNWKYSEVGDFIDFSDDSVFFARYVDSGTAVGPVVLAGLRAAVSDVWLLGGEVKWQKAEGKLDPDVGFLGDRIDLGGWNTSFTVHLRF